ncbi:hypothetical protein [[Eubacterium] cellulosolvens]
MDAVESVIKRLKQTPGLVACWVLPDEERDSLRRLETEANLRLGLQGMEIVNEGIKNVLDRQHVIIIHHSPALRHPPGPIVVILDEERVVGEEIWEPGKAEKLAGDPTVILLGKSLAFNREALMRARGKPLKLAYKALPFPEVEELPGIRDVISVTITFPAHFLVARKAGWDEKDPTLGTVLIGFNEAKHADA